MTDINKKPTAKEIREAYALVGRIGGKSTFKKIGKKGMSALGKRGAEIRWSKVDKK